MPDEARLLSRDVGGPGSPVARYRAAGSEPRDGAAVGVYPALASATSGVVVLLGVRGDPGIVWARGWREGAVLAEWPECRVIRADSALPR